jgi:uncharacterized membrane protein YphA (DoxX/SURF4 family)
MAAPGIPHVITPQQFNPLSSDAGKGTIDGNRCVQPQRPFPPKNSVIYITWMLRLVVGGAFIFAGVLKIADPAKFAIDVSNYRLVPHELINLVAILMPWMEVVAGAFVLAGIWLRAAAMVITSMTVMFAIVILSALARGLNIECGCFGTLGGKNIGLVNLLIDTTLFCLAAWLARCGQGFRSSARKLPAQPADLDRT